MDNLALAIGVLAGLVQLAGYWQYNQAMTSYYGHKPSTASWLMWGLGGGVELLIFDSLVQSWSKDFLPMMCAVAAIFVFLRMWWRGVSFELERWDVLVIIPLDLALVAFYVVSRDPIASNVFLGVDILVSFLPTLWGTWKKPISEHPSPWRTWTFAYALLTMLVLLQWENGWELIYPVSCMVLHGTVWYLAQYRSVEAAGI